MNGTRLGAGLREKLDAVFKGKHSRTLLFVGIAGMALIFLSTVIQTGGSNKPNPASGRGSLPRRSMWRSWRIGSPGSWGASKGWAGAR